MAVRQNPNTFIFSTMEGNPQSSAYLNLLLRHSLQRCQIDKHVTVHGLRHTGISYFLRHGIDIKVISEQAGHSEVSTTQNIYYNLVSEQLEEMRLV